MIDRKTSLQGLGVLIVDDEDDVRRGLMKLVSTLGADVSCAPDGKRALEIVRQGSVDVVVSDIRMPRMTGIELLETIQSETLPVEVLLMTGFGTIELAVECMGLGAAHFIAKPFDNHEMLRSISSIGERLLSKKDKPKARSGKFVAHADTMRNLMAEIDRISSTVLPVLIEGETGTGKEVVAQEIHRRSQASNRRFDAVNCAALPDTLLESELFGHKEGAFTGATEDREGLFQTADGGTVFLDEVASMSPAFQGKLLRVLQDKVVRPLGGTEDIHVDFRLLAATNQDLELMVEAGKFRSDLLYRLRVLHLKIPALRDRPDDISALSQHFVQLHNQDCRSSSMRPPEIDIETDRFLRSHAWPGNVRELENAVMRALVACAGAKLSPHHFDIVPIKVDGASYDESKKLAIERFQQRYVEDALRSSQGNVSQAAMACGLTRAALQKIMRKLDIRREHFMER